MIGYELRKLFRLPALWVFLLLCLALNILLIFTSDYGRSFFNDTSETALELGQQVNEAFVDALGELPQTENRDILLNSVDGVTDTFDDFDVNALSQYYENMVEESPTAVRWMQSKYEKLSARVAELAESDASLDIYAGPMTHDSHQFLYGTLLRAVSAESCTLAALAVLYLFGYEKMNKTDLNVCVSRTGRRLWRTKTVAGILAGLAMFSLLAGVSLGVYFSVWDYSGIWSANVSSSFNYIEDVLMVKPFITWGDFTVAEYLAAALALIAAMAVISSLVSAVIGTLIQNTWAILSVVLLLSPTLVRDRIRHIQAAQWSSRKGRRILNIQLAAAGISALVLTLINLIVYAVPILMQHPLVFKDFWLFSFQIFQIPWFDWTYGQYLIVMAVMILVLALAAGGLTVVLSQYSGNYVAMLLKALPLFTVLAFLTSSWIMEQTFFVGNPLSSTFALPGAEFVTVGILAALGIGLRVFACRRQLRREL